MIARRAWEEWTREKSYRVTKSMAGSWQGFLWNDAIVPTFGWRYDEVASKSITARFKLNW